MNMLEKSIIVLVVLVAALYLLRRSLKKGSGCGCSGSDGGAGNCGSGCGCSGGASQPKPLDISSCTCRRKDG